MTLLDAALKARGELEDAGVSSSTAALDAELLARHVLGWDRAKWLVYRTDQTNEAFSAAYAALIARRSKREPVAYIRGIQEFWGREFLVTHDVLIPRSETELTIEVAKELIADRPTGRLVDVGTGSGCIAITLALDHPALEVHATDISAEALIVARENARRLGANTVRFAHGAYLGDTPRPIDLLVTNPPYVATTDRPALAPEVKEHEPSVALFGGNDGMQEVRAILQLAPAALAAHGWLVMEIGYGQDDRVTEEIARVPELRLREIRADLQGIPRVAVVGRASDAG